MRWIQTMCPLEAVNQLYAAQQVFLEEDLNGAPARLPQVVYSTTLGGGGRVHKKTSTSKGIGGFLVTRLCPGLY